MTLTTWQTCHVIGLYKKSAGSELLLVPPLQGIWHSRYIVERATQSLRRMIMTIQCGKYSYTLRMDTIIIPEDIYRCLILDDAFETARFLKRPRIKRSKRFHISMTSHVPARYGASRRKVSSKVNTNSTMLQ